MKHLRCVFGTSQVNNFSPLGVVEIFFVTAIGGVLPYLILTFLGQNLLWRPWTVGLAQRFGLRERTHAETSPMDYCGSLFSRKEWRSSVAGFIQTGRSILVRQEGNVLCTWWGETAHGEDMDFRTWSSHVLVLLKVI